ncbi:Cell division suppressor protein YneA [compost metagenome]
MVYKKIAKTIYTVDVCPGDTLWDIAVAHLPEGESVRSYINKIKKENGLKNADIRAGQILVLP